MIPESEYERQRAERLEIELAKQANELESLRRQLAECQKEKDEWSSAMEVYWKLANERLTALTECQQERDRLHAMLNKLVGAEAGMPCNCLGGDLYGECDYCDGRKLLQALDGAEGE